MYVWAKSCYTFEGRVTQTPFFSVFLYYLSLLIKAAVLLIFQKVIIEILLIEQVGVLSSKIDNVLKIGIKIIDYNFKI